VSIDQALASNIDQRFTELDSAMAPYQTGTGWTGYDQLQPADLRMLSQAVNNLAEPLSQVAARVVVASGGTLGN